MADLNSEVRYIKGIGEKRAKLLEKLGVQTLFDLIRHFPRAYEDRTVIKTVAETEPDETVCVKATVTGAPVFARSRRGLEFVKLRAADDTGTIDIIFFNRKYIKDQLKPGARYIFYGKVAGALSLKTMTNPVFEPEDKQSDVTGRIVPVYRLTSGISGRVFMNLMRRGLDMCGSGIPDILPDAVRAENKLAEAVFAYENIHFPADPNSLDFARRRLIFEELFVLACALGLRGGERRKASGIKLRRSDPDEFYASLPFSPTGAQMRAIKAAELDMCSGKLMNRMIQGDVGSGKTLAAAACIWLSYKNGLQSAFMAPTEVLAAQHFKTLLGFLSPFGVRACKLTGSMTAKQKKETKDAVASGEFDLVVGTHALLSEDAIFPSLGLVITDEQHRFGVGQRGALSGKGQNPHVLVMSATPIPRTLALVIYGDLDVSVLDEMPPGRKAVKTFTINEELRARLYGFVRKLVSQGRQVFAVCPAVEENEDAEIELRSAEEHARELKKEFPDLAVACVHGRMKPKDKDAVMAAFSSGEIDILVSTTVIEVGIDVPNAALMIIENAERFGLSQLHQLRGRVGRGDSESYCVLISDPESKEARKRLKIMCETSDGFKISEEDLRLRGPGDFFGSRQHGLPDMRIADLCSDVRILDLARTEAERTLKRDPCLTSAENSKLLQGINELFNIKGKTFN
ncbi:MAG: ATP-dependent DNA helicase RecG [Oscillospiraceae bacterium]|nr:ATP-dependent DNA helicase RecG [Oscillospiraceae bacterium]